MSHFSEIDGENQQAAREHREAATILTSDQSLALVEYLAANGELETMNDKNQAACKLFGDIYRIAHTIRAPDCRPNHASWAADIANMYKSALPEIRTTAARSPNAHP